MSYIKSYDEIPIDEKYKVVFSTLEGKDVLNDMLEFCRISQSSYNQKNPVVNDMILNEGKRMVGLYILSIINQEPINYVRGKLL